MTAVDGAGSPAGRSPATERRSRWSGIAVRLFPAAWQERFGAEFGALLDATPPTPRVVFDVLVAAVDAHVHPTGPRRRWPLMIERLRLNELTVFASWIVFVVAGLVFQRMTEGPTFTTIAAAEPAVGWAWWAIVAGAVISLGAVLIAGVPIATAIARAGIARRDSRQVGLLAVPPVSLAIWVGLTVLLLSLGDPPAGAPWRIVVFAVWAGGFVLAAVASTVAVSAAALDAPIDGRLYRRAAVPAVVTAVAMVGVTVACGAWGVALLLGSPAVFWGSEGILATSTALTWFGVLAVMAATTAVAVRTALRVRADSRA